MPTDIRQEHAHVFTMGGELANWERWLADELAIIRGEAPGDLHQAIQRAANASLWVRDYTELVKRYGADSSSAVRPGEFEYIHTGPQRVRFL